MGIFDCPIISASGKPELARKFYDKVIGHTIDPVMEIYASLIPFVLIHPEVKVILIKMLPSC
jgi:hypothetical protein